MTSNWRQNLVFLQFLQFLAVSDILTTLNDFVVTKVVINGLNHSEKNQQNSSTS